MNTLSAQGLGRRGAIRFSMKAMISALMSVSWSMHHFLNSFLSFGGMRRFSGSVRGSFFRPSSAISQTVAAVCVRSTFLLLGGH